MFRKYNLKSSVWHKPDIEFEWDPEARAVRGRDAAIVLDLVLDAVKSGDVISHPYPTIYETKNPLKNLPEMAAVLGQYWQLTDELAKSLPIAKPEEEQPVLVDAAGKHIRVDLLH